MNPQIKEKLHNSKRPEDSKKIKEEVKEIVVDYILRSLEKGKKIKKEENNIGHGRTR